jgi:hypothetical protein
MKSENPLRLAVRLWLGALFLFTSGCANSAGLSPLASTIAASTHAHSAIESTDIGKRLYISIIDGTAVLVYSAGSNPSLLQTISAGVPRPNGVWVDKLGVLYAVNVPDQSYQTSLPEYKPGAPDPFRTIRDGIVNVGTVAVDENENVFVTGIDTANGSFFLEIYPKGKLRPSETLTIPHAGLGDPSGLAFDSTGALLVGESLFGKVDGAVYRLPAGSKTFTNLDLHQAPGGAIAVDGSGNLYVGGNQSIAVYAPNAKSPSRTVRVQDSVAALTVASDGELYVGTRLGVSEYAPGAKNATTMISVQGHIGGLALSP